MVYGVCRNALRQTPGHWHVRLVHGDLAESEESAARRGTFTSVEQAQAAANKMTDMVYAGIPADIAWMEAANCLPGFLPPVR